MHKMWEPRRIFLCQPRICKRRKSNRSMEQEGKEMMEVVRALYQILLAVLIVYTAVRYPERESFIMVLCTWYVVSVIREGR